MKLRKRWDMILAALVIALVAILLLINFKTTFLGESTIGVILEYEPRRVSRGSSVYYGYEIDGISYVDSDSYSRFQSAKEGGCIEIRHSNNYPFESVVRGKSYECESLKKSLVYGDLNGKNSDDTVFVFVHSNTNPSLKKFVLDKYYLVLDTIGVYGVYQFNFYLKNHREKVLLIDLNKYNASEKNCKEDTLHFASIQIPTQWILNLDANFEKGQGSDTARFVYSHELDEIVPIDQRTAD